MQAVVDISGRPYLVHTGEPAGFEFHLIGGHFTGSLVRHVFEAISFNAALTTHIPSSVGGIRPHRRSRIQGVREGVPAGQGIRSARHGDSVHKGRPVTLPSVVVLDYGSGNVHSAAKALEAAGARVELTADRHRAEAADGLVVPGVGAFSAVMHGLREVRGDEIIDRRLAGGRAVLGICVGMQVLFEDGIERGVHTEGLGEWPGRVEQLDAPVLPHMGWNTVQSAPGSVLFDGLTEERFYFVHSYAASRWSPRSASVPAALRDLVAARQPFRGSGRERPAECYPVSPREVRRSGYPIAPELAPNSRMTTRPDMAWRNPSRTTQKDVDDRSDLE